MKEYFKVKFHNWIIKKLTKYNGGGLSPGNINQKTKIIDFGLYSIHAMFFEPKHKLYVHWLCKYFGYKCIASEYSFQNL